MVHDLILRRGSPCGDWEVWSAAPMTGDRRDLLGSFARKSSAVAFMRKLRNGN